MTEAAPAAVRPAPGTPVSFRWRKWDGSVHWEHECVYLGSDEWGDWVGQRAGWLSERPGRRVRAADPNVSLIPASGDYAATLNAAPHVVRIYIDLAWDLRWTGVAALTGIDMDLDVVLALDERGLYIDDRDEWEEHSARYGYPADVMSRLEARALELERTVGAGVAPYDGSTAEHWLARLAELTDATA